MIKLLDINKPKLINFLNLKHFKLDYTQFFITDTNIVHIKRVKCPDCGTLCSYNGSSNKGWTVFSNSYGAFFRKGQQFCSNCKKTIQVENPYLDDILKNFLEIITSQVLSLSESLSEKEIHEHLKRTMNIKISLSTIHNIKQILIKNLNVNETSKDVFSDFYGYDEQHLKIRGKTAYRIVILDIKENDILYEAVHPNFSKEILITILKKVFKGKKPKGFVTDMRLFYPDAFKEVFGKDIILQFCLFHLNKLLLKTYSDSLKMGKTVNWTLSDKKMLYLLFDIFYDRTSEIKKLDALIEINEKIKQNLTEEQIEYFATLFNIPKKKESVLKYYEKKLIKEFNQFCKQNKISRKREKRTLIPRTKEEAEDRLIATFARISSYPKAVRKAIRNINERFKYFVASKGEVTTNNKLEGFFGATLKKVRKKINKTIESFSALLKFKQLIRKKHCLLRHLNYLK